MGWFLSLPGRVLDQLLKILYISHQVQGIEPSLYINNGNLKRRLSLSKPTSFTREDVIRIQRAAARKHGGSIPKGSFAAKAQSIYDKQQADNNN